MGMFRATRIPCALGMEAEAMAADDDLDGFDTKEQDEHVPLLYADSVEEAERICQILEDHDVPALPDEEYEDPEADEQGQQGVAVLVPESMVDEAEAILDDLEELEALGEEEEDFEDEEDEEDLGDEELDLDEEEDDEYGGYEADEDDEEA